MNQPKFSKFWVGPKDPNRTRYETDGAISLLDPNGFKIFLKRFSWRIISLCLRRRGESISLTIRMYHNFGQYLLKLNKFHGPVFVVKYLKASQLAMQKKIAGQPLDSLRELEPDLPLPRLSKSGLPAIIGLRHRRAIYSGSYIIVRLWLTLFSLYRVIKIPCKGKINTITDPFSGDLPFLTVIGDWMRLHVPVLLADKFNKGSIGSARLLPLEKASPSNGVSWNGFLTDAVALSNSNIFQSVKQYCLNTGNDSFFYRLKNIGLLFNKTNLAGLPLKLAVSKDFDKALLEDQISLTCGEGELLTLNELTNKIPLGQLSFKEEAAGKLRVFAMVDVWTQSLMRPLHDALFDMLKSLPNDGTFNQEASFEYCIQQASLSGAAFGYDLSAATDRLPISLQVDILSVFIGKDAAEAWKEILVGREYRLPNTAKRYGYTPGVGLTYSVGQPMGALSSWAMLAVTHHLIVQYCNWTIRPTTTTWFTKYAILGDDIQIFDPEVAAKYLEVCNLLGVSINLSKSVVSEQLTPVVEYAKRTSMGSVDVSALSWKMLASQDSAPGRVMVGVKVYQKGIFDSLLEALRFATAKDRFPLRKGSAAYGIISFYTSLFKKGLVSWRWLLERLATPQEFTINYASSRLPQVPYKEFEQVVKIVEDGGDPSDLPEDWADERPFIVESRYIQQTESVVRERILKMRKLLSSESYLEKCVIGFIKSIYAFSGQLHPNSINAVDDVMEDFLMIIRDELHWALKEDLHLRKLDFLMNHLDYLEELRRKLEIGIVSRDRKVAITSDLYVLKKISEITSKRGQKMSEKRRLTILTKRKLDWMNYRNEVMSQAVSEFLTFTYPDRYMNL